jgi:multidrug efflux pump
MGFEWTELTYQQIEAGKDLLTKLVFPLAVVFVFLVLAAQYESWSLPLAVILVVPMCLLSAVVGVTAMPAALQYLAAALKPLSSTWSYTVSGPDVQADINIFTQIGFVVLVGLASKNAILIVEFAKEREEEGMSRIDAAIEACRLRLRPILMTSFAFGFGVLPLVLAHGAGAEMRFALGVAVFSGMIGVTVFGLFLTPVFYVTLRRITSWRRG